ncbi:decaprenyl-phosphate phosphoribosyltransferase [Candidatus Woesearchaeota archaeon]|nr:decaprenyl-phosphate phosphoribosyltransferase [Candidatus Woesearchaeota archaeon]
MNEKILSIKAYADLLRTRQWYKNLVVFLAIFFSGSMFSWEAWQQTIIAFFVLSWVSSAGYIINDLQDRREDQHHPERRTRPLAAGKISPTAALFTAFLLLGAAAWISWGMNGFFAGIVGAFFALSVVYTFFLKRIIFADILTIATLFVFRAVAGAATISVFISPWLILVPFFLALFLAAGKRHSELYLLDEKAAATKKVLQEYTQELARSLMIISTTLLIFSYALYSFLSEHTLLIITLPLALYTIFRFYGFICAHSPIARQQEKIFKDPAFLIGMILWILAAAVIIYAL